MWPRVDPVGHWDRGKVCSAHFTEEEVVSDRQGDSPAYLGSRESWRDAVCLKGPGWRGGGSGLGSLVAMLLPRLLGSQPGFYAVPPGVTRIPVATDASVCQCLPVSASSCLLPHFL